MFGSNDDKKSPAAAGAQTPPVTEEKKSLFGWLRKKPAESAAPAAEAPLLRRCHCLSVLPQPRFWRRSSSDASAR